MYSERGDPIRAGFPHSEIRGSKPICRLPAAYRRLSRPSSPIIAKASTTCTYSLDPITLPPHAFRAQSTPGQSPPEQNKEIGKTLALKFVHPQSIARSRDTMQYITQLALARRPHAIQHAPPQTRTTFTFYPRLLKSKRVGGGSGWIRTIDPRLIKTVL